MNPIWKVPLWISISDKQGKLISVQQVGYMAGMDLCTDMQLYSIYSVAIPSQIVFV